MLPSCIFLMFVGFCACKPAMHPGHFYNNGRGHNLDNSNTATILQQDYVNAGNSYNFGYQTSDGISREEKAVLKSSGSKSGDFLVVEGSYSYIGTDGVIYTVKYIADENGYRAIGQHLPAVQN